MAVLRGDGGGAGLEVGDVEVGQGVVDEAVHGARVTVHVLVHEPGNEIRRERDHKSLVGNENRDIQHIYYIIYIIYVLLGNYSNILPLMVQTWCN